MSLDALADLTNVGSLLAFSIVCITVIYLRYAQPGLVRPFRTPLFPLTPILGAAMCLFLLMAIISKADTRAFFLVYLGLGLIVYFAYGLWNSKLGKGEIVGGHEAPPDLEMPKRIL
jgi:APA family basic amino acid/polyamine antiporter